MSEHSTKSSTNDDEIDLNVVFKAIQNFFLNILKTVFSVFTFYYRHKFILLGLIVLGAVLGYFYEQNVDKTYTNDLLVIPNFTSSEYLYSKIETLDKKLSQQDSLFLKDIFGVNYKSVKSIHAKPVVDIYSFVSRNETNQELFELLFEEEGNIEFIENPINSRSFKFHHIYLEIKGDKQHKELSKALLAYINDNEYFNDLRNITIDNFNLQLRENKEIITQIDSIVSYAQKDKSISLGDSEFSFSDNSGLNELLSNKKILIDEQKELEATLLSLDETIKLVDANYKVIDKDILLRKDKKKLFPLFLVLIYSFVFLLRFISRHARSINS